MLRARSLRLCRPPLAAFRLLSSAAGPSAPSPSASAARRAMRSPVTWLSAAATLGVLYAGYEWQYQRQLHRQRAAGRPDLGGPWSLVGVDGQRVTSEQLQGQWVLLYFGFTKCPDICPQEMDKLTAVLRSLDGKGQRVLPVFITIDPARDDAPRLKAYFGEGEFHERFLPLTGSFEEVRRACRAYRVYFTKPTADEIRAGDYLIDHSIISYLLSPEGHFIEYFGKSLSAAEAESKMTTLITEWERERYLRATLPQWVAEAMLGPVEVPKGRTEAPKLPPIPAKPVEIALPPAPGKARA
mmetsp:Transcript_6121/g.19278  ORF Transcript_6121/g.19278 Transcript_6121/m.19278 type:complete len:298 (-) Transcript_6121:321-1214(-)